MYNGVEKRGCSFKKEFIPRSKYIGESVMKLEVSVPELVEVFKEIQKQPEQIFERGWRSWGHGTARSRKGKFITRVIPQSKQ